jgi:CheY-like chemotaxis protein
MMHKNPAVLIVDDDEAICDLVCEELTVEGYICNIASNAGDALAKLKINIYDVALLDIKLPGMSGMDLLKTMKKCYQMTAIVMMTAVKDIETAIQAMKLGASDYIVKPFTFEKLNSSITTVLKNEELCPEICHTISCMGYVDCGKNASGTSLSEINTIAYGVDAQVDYFDFHSKIVTNKTVELARWLGLPGNEIEKWAVARIELYSERDRRISSALSKLDRNSIAQLMLGFTRSIY